MSQQDSLVRHVRTADALIDRIAAVDHEQRNPSAAGELFTSFANGVSVLRNNDGPELRLGEARQLAPSVWDNLDEALAILARRGVAHDARVREGAVRLVVDLGGLTAHVNDMRAASAAIKDACPDVDWVAIARTEEAEIAAAGPLRRGRWWGLVALVALLGIGAAVPALATPASDDKPPPLMDCFARCSRTNDELFHIKPPATDCDAAAARFCGDGRGTVREVRARPR